MLLLNCAFNKKYGKLPMYETFGMMLGNHTTNNSYNVLITIFIIFVVVLAIILAVRCNPNNQLAYGLIAFLFSEIYLIQFFIRKYIIQEKEYCKSIF